MLPQDLLHPPLTRPAAPLSGRIPLSPGPLARVLAAGTPQRLDRRLLDGEDPSCSAVLAARAARLTSARSRRALAQGLGGLADAAGDAHRRRPWLPRRSVLAENEPDLRELRARLLSGQPVYAHGMARVRLLLTGAAFADAGSLSRELARARVELAGGAAAERDGSPDRGPVFSRALARLRTALAGGRGERVPGPRRRPDPPGFVGGSFVLPDGSWFHGRRES